LRRPLTFVVAAMFVFALLTAGSLLTPASASAATPGPTTTCSNGVDNTGGLGLICRVTIVNRITSSGGTSSVTIRECHGAAGDPTAACSTATTNLTSLVTNVTQCNDSINGGGGTLRCSVQVINNFVGVGPGRTPATVNQCVGSGAGPGGDITTGCDPFPATTTGATITQCNGSANGLTLVQLTCTASGTKAAAHGVRINQCNGSANGGGALVICSASITNNVIRPAATATPSTGSGLPTAPATSIADPILAQPTGTNAVVLVGLSFLVALSLFTAFRRFGSRMKR
jgi:hypothetical protein